MVAGDGSADDSELTGPSTSMNFEAMAAYALAHEALQAALKFEEEARRDQFHARMNREEALRKLFHATMNADFAEARSEARNKHCTTISESPPPTLAVLQAAEASLKNQLEAAEEPSPEIEDLMWRDHVFLRDRRIAVLLSVHPRVGQDSRMGTLAAEIMILGAIIEIAVPWIDALTARSRAAAVVAANPLRAVLDGLLSASASSTEEERTAEDAVPAANHPRSSPDMIGGGGPAPTVKALTS